MVYGYKHGVHKKYCCRHSTTGADWKKEMVNATDNEADLYDMTAGERYTIQVNTVSYGTESKHPLLANHTVRKSYPHQSFCRDYHCRALNKTSRHLANCNSTDIFSYKFALTLTVIKPQWYSCCLISVMISKSWVY